MGAVGVEAGQVRVLCLGSRYICLIILIYVVLIIV